MCAVPHCLNLESKWKHFTANIYVLRERIDLYYLRLHYYLRYLRYIMVKFFFKSIKYILDS